MMNGSIVMFWRQSILEKYVENIMEQGFDPILSLVVKALCLSSRTSTNSMHEIKTLRIMCLTLSKIVLGDYLSEIKRS